MYEPLQVADALRQQAMLYAAGEMDPNAAEAFESRLGTDCHAQQALVQAVQLAGLVVGREYRPDPSYRSAVRSSLAEMKRPSRKRFWLTGVSTLAVCLLAVWFFQRPTAPLGLKLANQRSEWAQAHSPRPLPTTSVVIDFQRELRPASPDPDAVDAAELDELFGSADSWAELSHVEWLRRFAEFEQRRKLRMPLRAEDFRIERPKPAPQMQ